MAAFICYCNCSLTTLTDCLSLPADFVRDCCLKPDVRRVLVRRKSRFEEWVIELEEWVEEPEEELFSSNDRGLSEDMLEDFGAVSNLAGPLPSDSAVRCSFSVSAPQAVASFDSQELHTTRDPFELDAGKDDIELVDEISMEINALSDVHALDNAPPPAQGPPPARNTSAKFAAGMSKSTPIAEPVPASLPDANALDEISMDNAPPPARGPVPARMHGSGQFEYSKAQPKFAKTHTKHALAFEEGSDDSDY